LCEVCAETEGGNCGAVRVERESRVARWFASLAGAACLMIVSPVLSHVSALFR
jgi:hypothetical protein